MGLTIFADNSYTGEGVSLGLARGLLVGYNGNNITREGMGTGAVALRHKGFTFFSKKSSTRTIGKERVIKKFVIDRQLVWSVFGIPSVLMTKFSEKISEIYRKRPVLQKTLINMSLVSIIRRLLGLKILFKEVKPMAEATVKYRIKRNRIHVDFSLKLLQPGPAIVYLMNELGADFFNAGMHKRKTIPAPSGWEELSFKNDLPYLFSKDTGIGFSVKNFSSHKDVPARVFWGREKVKDLCWAGFEFEFGLDSRKKDKIDFKYAVDFTGGKGNG